jgi:hypothetical protein
MRARYVVPATAGISGRKSAASHFPETPAFAGVTGW